MCVLVTKNIVLTTYFLPEHKVPQFSPPCFLTSPALVFTSRPHPHIFGHVSCSYPEPLWLGLYYSAMLYCLLPKYRHLSPFICKTRETLLLFTTKGVILKERRRGKEQKGGSLMWIRRPILVCGVWVAWSCYVERNSVTFLENPRCESVVFYCRFFFRVWNSAECSMSVTKNEWTRSTG